MIDWTLNVGTLVQIVVIAGGGLAFLFAIKGHVAVLAANQSEIKLDMFDVKVELKELRNVLQVQVDHDGRLTRAEADVRELRADLKELRHGEGFVFPLKPVGL
jgi:hypothetical protein